MNHFWRWARDETDEPDERTLYLDGTIAEESWYDDDVTPDAFKSELLAGAGPVTVEINSPGGDTIAASQIYTMLKDYPYPITVKITGLAASAASVVAMAGDRVCMSPTSILMIHNPYTMAMGDSAEMRKAGQLLDEVKAGIINAYQMKTGLSRREISRMMDNETWMNPIKAKELGFCDEILYQDQQEPGLCEEGESMFFSAAGIERRVMNRVLNKLKADTANEAEPVSETATAEAGSETATELESETAAAEAEIENATESETATEEPEHEEPEESANDPEQGIEPALQEENPPAAGETPAGTEESGEPEQTADTPIESAPEQNNRVSADSLIARLDRLKYTYI